MGINCTTKGKEETVSAIVIFREVRSDCRMGFFLFPENDIDTVQS